MNKAEQELLDKNFLGAVMNGAMDEVKKYLAQGASINTTNYYGLNALIFAARHGRPELVLFLLDAGIDKNHQSNTGSTALIEAVQTGGVETVKVLRSYQVNADLLDEDGYAAIHHAVNDAPMLKALLETSVDVNLRTANGMTPLMMVVYYEEKMDAFRALLEAGADTDAADNKGMKLWDYTASRNLKDAERYIKEYEIEKNNALEEELSVFKKGLARPIKATRPIGFK